MKNITLTTLLALLAIASVGCSGNKSTEAGDDEVIINTSETPGDTQRQPVSDPVPDPDDEPRAPGSGPIGTLDPIPGQSPLTCLYGGDTCSESSDCCSGSCENGVCAQRTCDTVDDCALGASAEGFECAGSGFCVEQCSSDADCRHAGWVCTQGGRCIDSSGAASATVAVQADLDELGAANGLAVRYALPDNVAARITDPDGDGVGLTIGNEDGEAVLLDGSGGTLLVDRDVVGVRVAPGGAYSAIEDLRIDSDRRAEDAPHAGIGVDVAARGVRLNNLYIRGMGTGIRAHAAPGTDLSGQQWAKIRLDSCHHDAISVEGEGIRHGTMAGIEVEGGAGVRDASAGGNVWLGLRTAEVTGRSLELTGESQAATIVGAMVDEDGPAPSSASENSLWVSGNAVAIAEGPSERIGQGAGRLTFQDPTGLRVRLPGSDDAAIAWHHPDELAEWALAYDVPASMWMFSYGDGSAHAYAWTSDSHPDGPALQEVE